MNDLRYFNDKETTPTSAFSKLKQKLSELRFNEKFQLFLKLNDLDSAKFFAGDYTDATSAYDDIRTHPKSATNHFKKLTLYRNNPQSKSTE